MRPILVAMRRNAIGPVLIAAQIAVTLAIISNGLFIIHVRLVSMARPTGVDESSLFALRNQWIGSPTDIPARVRADLAALRSLPAVADAYVTNSYPLSGALYTFPITITPSDQSAGRMIGVYLADSHTLRTLGLRLIEGRNFEPADVRPRSNSSDLRLPPGGIIVTQAVAESLVPGGKVLGRTVTPQGNPAFVGKSGAPIIGIVAKLQVAGVNVPAFFHLPEDSAALLPYLYVAPNAFYVVRARSPALVGPAMQAAVARLYEVSRERVIGNVESLSSARQRIYRAERGQAIMLGGVSAILLAMTGWGIVGLTSCWMNQRRRQIGIRRALGASSIAIVGYFQAENLLIAIMGVVLGAGFAIMANLWLISHFQMPRLNYLYLLLGAAIVLVLGQLATFWPALRAAAIPPAVAARGL